MPRPALAALGDCRTLALDNIHTGEKLAIEYWVNGSYQPDALMEVNRLLRDFRTGEVYPIAPRLPAWRSKAFTCWARQWIYALRAAP